MNREIKFRAWDLDKKQMNFCIFIGIGKIFNMTKSFKPKEEIKNSVLMQYTGLKDKNGKEIYEGDIVKTETVEGIGRIIYRDDFASFVVDFESGCWDSMEVIMEIIGNIYENSGLLEGK